MKLTDTAIRQALKPRRRWNYKRCVPLQFFLWLLAGFIGALCIFPVLVYIAKVVLK